MGSCCSSIKRDDSFQEDQRRKSRDQAAQQHRRKSSGLSRYSNDGRHVLEDPLKIGAFNVRKFGAKKMKDENVVEILVKIIVQFDIMLIQEVQDKTEKSLYSLLSAVNGRMSEAGDTEDSGSQFQLISSPRLGRSEPKEQYAFFYRADRVTVLDSDVYPDEEQDTFIREPFVVKFSSGAVSDIDQFVIIAIHTQPKDAFKEIDSLADVHRWAERRMGSDKVVIAGDLNAGGSYVRAVQWENCRLRAPQYTWLISDHLDTTATNTLAAYDRIVTCSPTINSAVVTDSAGVYRFDEELGLDEKTTLQVSDHYPVFFSLKPAVHPTVTKNIQTFMAVYVVDKPHRIRSTKLRSVEEVVTRLSKLRDSEEGLVSYSALSTIKYKLHHHRKLGDIEEFYILLSVDIEKGRTHYQVQYKTELL